MSTIPGSASSLRAGARLAHGYDGGAGLTMGTVRPPTTVAAGMRRDERGLPRWQRWQDVGMARPPTGGSWRWEGGGRKMG
jgi:hypothetical protein